MSRYGSVVNGFTSGLTKYYKQIETGNSKTSTRFKQFLALWTQCEPRSNLGCDVLLITFESEYVSVTRPDSANLGVDMFTVGSSWKTMGKLIIIDV